IEARAFGRSGDRQHLGSSEYLAESLILTEVEGFAASIIETWNEHRPAIGEAEFVAAKGRNTAGVGDGSAVEEIAGIEGGVSNELEDRAMKPTCARAGENVCESGRAPAHFRRHPSGAGLDLLNRIHMEVGEGSAAHFGIANIRAVHGEDSLNAALSIDGELLGKVSAAIGICHSAGGEQKQLAEVALVERKLRDGLSVELLATSSGRLAGFF